jgi:phosphoribosyl 1,2-cyclic phosphate phosphodiesterase
MEKEPKLITTQEVLNGLRQTHHFPLVPFKPEIIVPKEIIEIEGVKLGLYPISHNHTPCFGVKMKGDKLFAYLPDLRRLPKNERRTFRDINLLILDGSSLGKRGQTRIHQSIEEGIKLAKELKPKLCYFTHIGHITGTHQELESYVQKNGGRNFHIAYDGLELEI